MRHDGRGPEGDDAVHVRGVGVVCALGTGVDAVLRALEDPSACGFHGPAGARAAYPAPFDGSVDLPRGIGRRLGRQPSMALAAVLEAVRGAGDVSEAGLVLGTSFGAVGETIEFLEAGFRLGQEYASPMQFAGSLHNTMAGVVTRELAMRGPSLVVCNGDASFETALVAAMAMLRGGRVRRVIVGASDAYHPTYGRALARLGLQSSSPAPIDPAMQQTTRGCHPGEGAAALLLELGPAGAIGPRIESARVGPGTVTAADDVPCSVQLMATGDTRSLARHRVEFERLTTLPLTLPSFISYPAARFGAFGGLSAVAVAVEAARRMRRGASIPPTLFLNVPYDAPTGAVTLGG